MYIGYKEVQQGDKVVFYLQGAFGGEVAAASGQLRPSSGTDNGNSVIEYTGSHPAALPITTQNKEDLVQWLQAIIDVSNKTMQQEPVNPNGNYIGGTTAAAPEAPTKQQNQNDIQMQEDPNDSEETMSDPDTLNTESESGDEQKQETKMNISDTTATAGNRPSNFRFVSYREQFRGLSETGHPPRRMWQWLLKDAQGREHIAVNTTRWEQGKKRFTYEAVPPFSQVKPIEAHNKRAVIEYLNHFVPPGARHSVPSDSVGGSRYAPMPGADGMGAGSSKKSPGNGAKKSAKSPSSAGKKSAKNAVAVAGTTAAVGAAAAPSSGKGKKAQSAIKQQQKREQGRDTSTFITNTAKRNETRQRHVTAITQQLGQLHSECGVKYSLTLVGSDGSMEVITSKESTSAAVATTAVGALNGALEAALLDAATGNTGSGAPATAAASPVNAKRKKQQGKDATPNENKKVKLEQLDIVNGAVVNMDIVLNNEDTENKNEGNDGQNVAPQVVVTTKRSRKNIPEDPDVAALFQSMKNNDKIYLSGKWIRDPLPPHPLQETLENFQVAEDCGEESDRKILLNKLIADLPNVDAAGPGATSNPPKESDILVVVNSLPEPVSSSEVELQPVWGIDSYTRCLLLDALKCCPQLHDDVSRDQFIDSYLIPTLNGLGDDGWDIQKALTKIEKKSTLSEEVRAAAARVFKAFEGLEEFFNEGNPVKPEARKHVRAHPKGEGVVVTAAVGLPSETFLGEYVGELYTAWRWAEREVRRRFASGSGTGEGTAAGAIAARKAATRMGASSEYYNIVLERPKTDPRGYDVLYVDAVQKGNFVSRLSHSCNPNCRSVTVVVNGRLTVGVWTTRDVAVGEELTVDFAGETDLEREGKAAVCLCGSAPCRGTFLYVTPGVNSPLNAVVAAKLSLPDRCGMILDAAAAPTLSNEDNKRLRKHGFKELMLFDGLPASSNAMINGDEKQGSGSGGAHVAEEVPAWLKKWLSLAFKFVETEAKELETILTAISGGSNGSGGSGNGGEEVLSYTEEETADEIEHLVAGRIHSLAVALDKVKLFLRHQKDELKATAPLCMLSDSEVAEYLWSGETSVAQRALGALASYAKQQASIRSAVGKRGSTRRGNRKPRWKVAIKAEEIEDDDDEEDEQEEEATGQDGTTDGNDASTPAPSSLNDKNAKSGGENTCFTEEITQLVTKIEEMLEGIEASTADAARTALRRMAALLRHSGPCHLAMHDILQLYAGTRNFMSFTQYAAFSPTLANGNEGLRYKQAFLWGVLTNWHRSTDPVDTLLADRRGCVLLPDVESCYMPSFSDGKYAAPGGDRSLLLRTIWENPRAGWPKNCIANFTFRHNQKVFGSPQLDVALRDDGDVACRGLVENLQAVAK